MTFTRTDLGRRAAQRLACCAWGSTPSRRASPARGRNDAGRILDFCAAIVDATSDLVLAYKPQIAYFAAHGAEAQLQRLIAHIHRVAPGVPVILDAKRGDIGSTAEQYAREASSATRPTR
jgi:orotidine-5'-phosphate decarboxylase